MIPVARSLVYKLPILAPQAISRTSDDGAKFACATRYSVADHGGAGSHVDIHRFRKPRQRPGSGPGSLNSCQRSTSVARNAYRCRRGSPGIKTCNAAHAVSAAPCFIPRRYLGVGLQVYPCLLESAALSPAASRMFRSIGHLAQAKGARPGPRRDMWSQLEGCKALFSL